MYILICSWFCYSTLIIFHLIFSSYRNLNIISSSHSLSMYSLNRNTKISAPSLHSQTPFLVAAKEQMFQPQKFSSVANFSTYLICHSSRQFVNKTFQLGQFQELSVECAASSTGGTKAANLPLGVLAFSFISFQDIKVSSV